MIFLVEAEYDDDNNYDDYNNSNNNYDNDNNNNLTHLRIGTSTKQKL